MKKVLLFSNLILGLGVTATTASAQTVQNKSDLMKNGTSNESVKQPICVGKVLPSLGNDNYNTLSSAGLAKYF